MPDDLYASLSREELIERLRELETDPASKRPAAGPSTEDLLHQSALQDSEQRIRAILNTAVEGIVTIDERGVIESVNPAAEKMFGYPADELVGRNVSVLMPPPYRQEHDHYLANYRQTGHAKIIGIGREVVGQRKDGTVFPMDLSVGEVRLAQARLFTGIVRDITERKKAEARLAELAQTLAEKNKELETVVYVASHDLRSPLVNIQGFSKELSHTCDMIRSRLDATAASNPEIQALLQEDIPEAIGFILTGVAKIDSLLSGFLRFSRLGRASLEIRRLNMAQMVAEIARTFEYEIKQAGILMRVGQLPDCYGDSTQINQVFSNLIGNAIKYRSLEGTPEVTVSGLSEKGESIYTVSDNGIGIAPEHQGKIFEIFHRLNPGVTQGEGLGLTIAQRILERHGGRIWLESTPNKGSTFHLALPATPRIHAV